MHVSKQPNRLFIIALLLISTSVLFTIYFYPDNGDLRLRLLVGLTVSVLLITVSGKLFHYHQMLNQAKQNLDEAQRLANLGSWERDLATGKGYWSDNHYRLFNLPPRTHSPDMEEFFLMIHSEERQQARETVLEAIRSNGSYEIKYRLEGDKKNRIFLSRGKVLHNSSGKPVTLIGTLQDITHKHRRDQFREELLKQKDLFISRLGHDLKTPLTPLVAFLPLIRSQTDDPSQQKLLDLCVSSVNHINDLVAKTLKLARLTSPADLHPQLLELPLAATVDSAISGITDTGIVERMKIENLIPPELSVRGNREQLEELFSQLISNAAKFSLQDPVLTIEAACDKGMITVVFRDNGIGLLPEELCHIFDDFYKADHSRHMLNSSGLGLSICRRIVENHGGRISASSSGRKCGTSISFTLEAGGTV